MKITYDKEADGIYIYLTHEKVAKTKRITGDMILDFDAQDQVVGIELLFVSKWVNRPLEINLEDITKKR